jgi:hypothetical protein
MTYKLNPEAIGFSYTREELFECITKIVAHPHNTVTEHDQSRALAIMVVFEDYLANFTHRDGDGEYYIPECDELDFQDFAIQKLGLEYYHYVDVDEVLK